MSNTKSVVPVSERAELARVIDAGAFGLTPDDVAAQWSCYSYDVYDRAVWVRVTPETIARVVGWLIRTLTDASN